MRRKNNQKVLFTNRGENDPVLDRIPHCLDAVEGIVGLKLGAGGLLASLLGGGGVSELIRRGRTSETEFLSSWSVCLQLRAP